MHGSRKVRSCGLVPVALVGLVACRSGLPAGDGLTATRESVAAAHQLASVMNGPMTHYRDLAVAAIGLSADQSTAAVGYVDGTVSTWSTSTGLEPTAEDVLAPLLSGDSALVDMALSPDGELIADLRETYDGRITWGRPFDPAGPIAEVSLPGEWISAALFSVHDMVLVGSAPLPFDVYPNRLTLMDTRGVPRASYTLATTGIQFHEKDPSHNYLLTRTAAGEYRAATTWQTEQQTNTGGQVSGGYLTWRPPDPPRLIDLHCSANSAVSRDGRYIACALGDSLNHVSVWDMDEARKVADWTAGADDAEHLIQSLAFFGHGRGLAVSQPTRDESGDLVPSVTLYDVMHHDAVARYPLRPAPGMRASGAVLLGSGATLVYVLVQQTPDGGAAEPLVYAFPAGRAG
jgi:WD40 repeat protein